MRKILREIQTFYEVRPWWVVLTVWGMILVIGVSDFLTGTDISLLIFYLFPIGFGTWFLGRWFGLLVALFSLAIWTGANELMGEPRHHDLFITCWNILSSFLVFSVFLLLLDNLKNLFKELEKRVMERTFALRKLEKDFLELIEKEERRVGHDLHDTVCQLLASGTMAVKLLEGKLAAKSLPEELDARKINSILQTSIEKTRDIAQGLSPISMSTEGFMDALHQMADRVSQRGMPCILEYDDPLLIQDVAVVTQLFFIIQEGVTNAVKHSKASRIVIRLKPEKDIWKIEVEDDGIGMSEERSDQGMGIRIMGYRALMIGARLIIQKSDPKGVLVQCILKISEKVET